MAEVNDNYLVDSHCHLNRLDLTKYQGNLEKALETAAQARVESVLSVATSLEEFGELKHLADRFPRVFISVGVHPSEEITEEPTTELLIEQARHPKVIAIGETGLDYHYQSVSPEIQQERLRTHIRAAHVLKKPLIIHTRESSKDILSILKEENASEVGGVFHCFTESWEIAQAVLDANFMIAFSGILTFQKAVQVQEVAKRVPLDRLLLETDAPYLAPHPMRGKPNEPSFLRYTAKYLAALREVSLDEIARQTTRNFFQCFRL